MVGVNAYTETEPNPLLTDIEAAIQSVDPDVEKQAIVDVQEWRTNRDDNLVRRTLDDLRVQARTEQNLMAATVACARAGVTTGEWAATLRDVFGEYRAPTGIDARTAGAATSEELAHVRSYLTEVVHRTGGAPLRMLVGKPGLDGHSNGAEQIAVRARDAGFEVVYQGIRLTPEQIVAAAVAEDVDVVGLSILSGSHRELVPAVLNGLRDAGAADIPVVVGGIIPAIDAEWLLDQGVAAVFTPKDYDVNAIMRTIVGIVEERRRT